MRCATDRVTSTEERSPTVVTSREGVMEWGDYATWYRVTGDLQAATPLVILHGGPGMAHDYLDSLTRLADSGRAVIHYDQVGCGKSSHHPDADPSMWTVELFLDELTRLLATLGIDQSGYHLLGQSWGGMLAAEFAVLQPGGLRSLILSNSPASIPTWTAEARRLRLDLPDEVRDTLDRHEAAGTIDDPEYLAAAQVFYDRHVCRVVPNPEEVQRSTEQFTQDPTVYLTMNGPTEFHCIGTIKDWTIEDRVHAISVPTLLLTGAYDEATELTNRPFAENIPDVRWTVFPESSHMPFIEEPEAYDAAVLGFLDEVDHAVR